MRLVLVVSVAFFALAAITITAQAPATSFIVARAGASYPAAPGGYVLATLGDVKSAAFAALYNPFGLAVAAGSDATVAVPHCAVVAVADGVLAFGPADNVSTVGPFAIMSGQWESGITLTGPVQFGAANGGFVGTMSAAFQAALYTVPLSQAGPQCYGMTANWAVYRPATFYAGRTGTAYPTGPTSDPTAVPATTADLLSPTFVTGYNAAGVVPLTYAPGDAGGCCAVRVAEGYLTYTVPATASAAAETFFVVWHYPTSQGPDSCTNTDGFVRLGADQRFATRWGSYGSRGTFLEQLGYDDLRRFNISYNGPAACEGQPANSYAVVKSAVPAVVPPTAAPPPLTPTPAPTPPAPLDCWEVNVEGSYNELQDETFCAADRWNYRTQNGTISDVPLNSADTCSSRIFAMGLSVTNYNGTFALAGVKGLTRCEGCNATDVFLPIRPTVDWTTVCEVAVGAFGWCRVRVAVVSNYACP